MDIINYHFLKFTSGGINRFVHQCMTDTVTSIIHLSDLITVLDSHDGVAEQLSESFAWFDQKSYFHCSVVVGTAQFYLHI